ncbi:hypothetical protein MB84_27580 (plasmid) [Pandoraea oxalativorans]|uniref:Uncharacterized protein n=2 Tax=Pandoraea oxalativorans TaxID=573737 RepID=A0A0G3IBP3_9BURK|nr:hypothetical protein MB84_27580 [Pandoraea oxalativorans]
MAVPIRLRVNGVWVHAAQSAVAVDAAPRTGSELLEQMIRKISAAFVAEGVPGNIAHVQAWAIARQLGCAEFLNADSLLSLPDVKQIAYQQALDVSIRGTQVCLHKTTTYKAQGRDALTQVVDLGVTFSTKCSYGGLGDTWRLEAQVTHAAVRLGGSLESDVLLTSDELVQRAGMHFKVPRAPSGFWECVMQVLSRLAGLLGKRGVEVVVGHAEALASLTAVERPPQLDLAHLDEDFDRSALLVSVRQDYGWWNNGVAEYQSIDGHVFRDNYLLDEDLQFEAYMANGEARADRQASLLLEKRQLTAGDDLRAGDRLAPASCTYRFAAQYLTQAVLAAQMRETLLEDLEATLGGDLFRYSMTNHHFITLGGANILSPHKAEWLEYAQRLRRQERAQTAEGSASAAELSEPRRRVDTCAPAPHLAGLSVAEQITEVKKRLVEAVVERIMEAFRGDFVRAWGVLAALAYAEKASQHVVIQGDGGPQFLNGHYEMRQISIFISNPTRPEVPCNAFIKFYSSQTPLCEHGEVRFGRTTIKRDRFKVARMSSFSFWRVTDDDDYTLVNAGYSGKFALNDSATPPRNQPLA